MNVTKEDAKTKWCPMARVVASATDSPSSTAHTGYNRVFIEEYGEDNFSDPRSSNPKISRCIADECMMWRNTLGGRGYCGIAGRPIL